MNQWIADYLKAQNAAHNSISLDGVAQIIGRFRQALEEDRQIFVFGNGGSAANASHFATGLGELAERVVVINDTHYGRVEDAHMGICHMICYAFMERPELGTV